MKSYCKGLTVTHELVFQAYYKWLKSESGHKNHWRVEKEYDTFNNLVNEIVIEVKDRNISFKPITYHDEIERNGKVRHIGQESVKQQLADYVVLVALEDFINARVRFYQVASVKGKGPLFAAKTVQKWVRKDKLCYVHGDIKKCYESIPICLVYHILAKYIKSPDIMYLLKMILLTYDNGLGIGSALSLKLSQVILSFVYHFVEKIGFRYRRGKKIRLIVHQIWYADDFYLFSKHPGYLYRVMKSLSSWIKKRIQLTVKPWKICWAHCEPVDVAGYVVREDRITIRAKIYRRIRRAYINYDRQPTFKKAKTVCSYWGYLKHTSSRKAIAKNNYYEIFERARLSLSLFRTYRLSKIKNRPGVTDSPFKKSLQSDRKIYRF